MKKKINFDFLFFLFLPLMKAEFDKIFFIMKTVDRSVINLQRLAEKTKICFTKKKTQQNTRNPFKCNWRCDFMIIIILLKQFQRYLSTHGMIDTENQINIKSAFESRSKKKLLIDKKHSEKPKNQIFSPSQYKMSRKILLIN